LSNGGEWQSYFLEINRKFNSGQTLYGSASVVRRFDLTDPYLMIGLVQPLNKSKRWIATFEASGSPRHQVLPQISFYGQLERNLGSGWIARGGLSYRRYTEDTVNIGVFGLERYFKQYRAAYTLYVAHLNGKGTSASHLIQGNYYYGERNSFGLGVAFGNEIESLGAAGLVQSEVRDISVNGRHWMNQKWGFSYAGWWHRQGDLYTRSGGQIGLLLRF
jgi:YaiO family outer membrane protein